MGGGFYDGDVAERSRSTNRNVFTFQGYSSGEAGTVDAAGKRQCHPKLNIFGKVRESRDSKEHPNSTPIVVAFDVTRSRGDDAKIMYSKLPMLIGQIMMRGYVPDPVICFAAIGDATSGDQAPIQVGQFESDNRLDENLSWIWLEEGGGGTGQESYELMAYYLANRVEMDNLKRGKKGYCFFTGDEGFYPEVSKEQVNDLLGIEIPENVPSSQVFKLLQEKYEVFFIYPQKSWEERKRDIDAEIRQRVEQAGGQYAGVDFRASLIWDTYDDLDLHVIAPSGEEIYYSNKNSRCGGMLDVDRNAGRLETRKPVENIRWLLGSAPEGNYKVFVRNYSFHEDPKKPVTFRVEVEINGHIQHFEDVISPHEEMGPKSDVHVGFFKFQKEKRTDLDELYKSYDDVKILNQWKAVLPPERILLIENPKAIVDVLLGALVVTEKDQYSLDDYIKHMEERGQTKTRCEQVYQALLPLTQERTQAPIPDRPGKGVTKRKGKTTRL